MGLDYTELLVRVEDKFGIDLGEEIEDVRTMGDLHALVLAELGVHTQPGILGCRTPSHFLKLRNALGGNTPWGKRRVRLETPMEQLLPWRARRCTWAYLQRQLGYRLPSLERPALLKYLLFAPWLIASLLLVVVLPPPNGGPQLALVLSLVYWPTVCLATRPFAVCIPAECLTVRMTLATLPSRHWIELPKTRTPTDSDDVWNAIKEIVAEVLDVRPEHVTPDADFFKDLGAG
jgi:acyl carrier protein